MSMTPLTRRLSRKTENKYSVLYAKPRRIVVTLVPGDILEFRELGRRHRWRLAVDTAFRYAVGLASKGRLKLLIGGLMLLLNGCDCDNPIKTRNSILRDFPDSEFFLIPQRSDCYIVRATNGAVYYVDHFVSTNHATKIFREGLQ